MDDDIGTGRIDDAVLALRLPGEPLKVCARVNPGQGCAAWTFPTAVVSPAAQPCSGRHDGRRAWKGFDRDATDRLHRKGMISDPMGKARSVAFTEKGAPEAERLFEALFTRRT